MTRDTRRALVEVCLVRACEVPLDAARARAFPAGWRGYVAAATALAIEAAGAGLRVPLALPAPDEARIRSETTRLDLRLAEAPQPRPGSRIEIDGEAFLIQSEPVRDRERLVWTVDLRPG